MLEKKIVDIKNMSTPFYNKKYPQHALPEDMIWHLGMLGEDTYILYPVNNPGPPKIPVGKLSYVILYEDPLSIYCFEHNELLIRKMDDENLKDFHYGHSSLAFIKDNKINIFDNNILKQKRLQQAAKPVLLAGHLHFVNCSSPASGGGTMLSWNVKSGHYAPDIQCALNNRIGFIKKLLPDKKFR
ncbi:hypothetical protein ACGVWS_02435 [Enterobacteriaceae bacterium LUAb1]